MRRQGFMRSYARGLASSLDRVHGLLNLGAVRAQRKFQSV